jgi:hypothetical protein
MIDEIRGAASADAGRPRPVAGDRAATAESSRASADPTSARDITAELRNRLAAASGTLETLLVDLSRVQSEARDLRDDTARGELTRRREELERRISTSEVAIQNIFAADGGAELPSAPLSPPGHDLDRQNVLQLLDRP